MTPRIFTPEYYEQLGRVEQLHPWSAYMQRLAFALLDAHSSGAPTQVLDAGCGAGYFTLRWREHSRIRVAVGIDSSVDALLLSRRRGLAQAAAASVAVLPFRSAIFDAVYCADVIQHLSREDAARTLAEFARVLCPGGLLLVRTAARRGLGSKKHLDTDDYQQWEPEKLRRQLEPCGFRVVWMSLLNWLPALVADLRAYGKPAPQGDVGLRVALTPVDGVRKSVLAAYWRLEQMALLRLGLRLPGGHTLLCLARKT
jgi:SAM-dependent methyltransferase